MKRTFVVTALIVSAVFMTISCGTRPIAAGNRELAAAPTWVRDGNHARYDRRMYLTAVGRGNSLIVAERDALGQLVTIFHQGIHIDGRVAEVYRSRRNEVATAFALYTEIDRSIEIVASMDNLIGAEIRDTWQDDAGANFAALAVLNRARVTRIYSEMLRQNQKIIANLTNTPPTERNTFDGYSRHLLAAVFADMSINYERVLSVIGAPGHPQRLRSGDDFRREAAEIRRSIPIGINVNRDEGGRIHGAFSRAFSEAGFRTGGETNPRFVLDVNIGTRTNEDRTDINRWIFVYMEFRADLIDTDDGNRVLRSYNFNRRRGHSRQQEAERLLFLDAEQIIGGRHNYNSERNIPAFRDLLSDFLSQLGP